MIKQNETLDWKEFGLNAQIVSSDNAPIIITHKNQPPVVMMSLAEYRSIQEPLYLLQTPRNTQRLTCAILELEQLISPTF